MSASAPSEVTNLSLSDVVARTGVPASTIHHYRRSGLIPPPLRQSANRFVYDQRHVAAVLAVRAQPAAEHHDCRERIVAAAIEAFKTRSYAEVSVSDIAEAAHMAKGNVYRYFPSKEALLTAAIETLLDDTTERFQSALDSLGGVAGLSRDPQKSALALGYVVADVMPILLELGARAAKGHEPSAELARRVLRTLAMTAGRPFIADDVDGEGEEAIQAGLPVIQAGFATVLTWSVGTDWPPDHLT
ncbi:MAG: TetR family transcriptional regulator [Actinomycetota bacterium]|nr:TetR family transcriptional regulator [Actinomycetota bacterium]